MSGNLTEIKFRLNQHHSQGFAHHSSALDPSGVSPHRWCSIVPAIPSWSQPLVWLLSSVPHIPTTSAAEAPFQMVVINRFFPRGILPGGIEIQCCCFISSDCRATWAHFISLLIVCRATVSQKHQRFYLILHEECML